MTRDNEVCIIVTDQEEVCILLAEIKGTGEKARSVPFRKKRISPLRVKVDAEEIARLEYC